MRECWVFPSVIALLTPNFQERRSGASSQLLCIRLTAEASDSLSHNPSVTTPRHSKSIYLFPRRCILTLHAYRGQTKNLHFKYPDTFLSKEKT